MNEKGFDGDWKIFRCSSASCEGEVERPYQYPSRDGFTMESLNNLSDFVDDGN